MASTPVIGIILGDTDLPWAELQAARLDGEVYDLGGAFCPIDEPESPRHRARAALDHRSRRLIAELATAAWVWGAAPQPERLQFAVAPDARAHLSPDQHATVREIVYSPADVVEFDGVKVTTPIRTAVDLARFEQPFEPGTVAQLAAIAEFTLADCLGVLTSRSGIPFKNRAIRNLTAALSP